MTRLLFLFLFLLGSADVSLRAERIDAVQAGRLARAFLSGHNVDVATDAPSGGGGSTVRPRGFTRLASERPVYVCPKGKDGTPYFYVFNTESGFVMVAGDTRLVSIPGYSMEGQFRAEQLPANFRAWLEGYAREAETLLAQPTPAVQTVREFPKAASSPSAEPVAPLMRGIVFGQNAPYNLLCPMDGDRRSVTGCVATAMAQVMAYHRWPERGEGQYSYVSKQRGFQLSANFAQTTFDWDHILTSYQDGSTAAEQQAVAQLLYAAGISVSMDYTSDASSAGHSRVGMALRDYFRYNPRMQFVQRRYFDHTTWEQLLRSELRAGRPVIYSGQDPNTHEGHAFVCEGADGEGRYYMNWGWNGWQNGYFSLSLLRPDDGNYVSDQTALIGVARPEVELSEPDLLCLERFSAEPNEDGGLNGHYFIYLPSLATFSGYTSLALYREDGTLVQRMREQERKIESSFTEEGWSYRSTFFTITTHDVIDVPDGAYKLRAEYRQAASEHWQPLYAGDEQQAELSVRITQHQFGDVVVPKVLLKVEDVHAPATVSPGAEMNYSFTLRNVGGADFQGRLVLAVRAATSTDAFTIVSSLSAVDVPAGGSVPQNFSLLAPEVVGDYDLLVFAAEADGDYKPIHELYRLTVTTVSGLAGASAEEVSVARRMDRQLLITPPRPMLIALFTLDGRCVRRQRMAQPALWDCSALPAGTYLLQAGEQSLRVVLP